jgi:hypothetical protein
MVFFYLYFFQLYHSLAGGTSYGEAYRDMILNNLLPNSNVGPETAMQQPMLMKQG